MAKKLCVLIVEDSEDDTLLLLRELRKGEYDLEYERVETPEAMMLALEKREWDIIISDYVLPKFSGLGALDLLSKRGLDLPFIIVSGNIGEDIAVGAMKAGAHDYIIKGNLKRLVPAIERELREAEIRRDRKRAEESLSVFKNLINQSSDSIFVVDPVTARLLDINDSACSSLGYSREELLNMRVIDFAELQIDLSRWKEHVKEVRDKDLVLLIDRCRRKDGSFFPVEVSIKYIAHEKKDYLVAIARDITDRKEMENRIVASNTLLRLLSTTMSRKEYLDEVVNLVRGWSGCECIGVRVMNEDGMIPYESYTGFSREFWEKECMISVRHDQCICTRVASQMHETQDAPMMTVFGSFSCGDIFGFIERLSEQEKARYRGVCVRNGFATVAVVPVRYGGKVIAAVHIADKAKYRLPGKFMEFFETLTPLIGEAVMKFDTEAERARLITAFESASDAIAITDRDELIQYVNNAFEYLTGYKRDEIVGRNITVLRGERQDSTSYDDAWNAARQGEPWRGRLTGRKKDGSVYDEETTITPVRDTSGHIVNYIVTKRDITERLRLESIAEAVNTMNNIGYVFSGIRHEIGNPINSIKMTLSVLKKKLDKYDKNEVMEYINRALDSTGRVEFLLRSLRSFNMYENPEILSLNISIFMDKFISLVTGDCERKGIKVSNRVEPGVKFISADPRALHQALLNVFTNAIDACEGRENPRIDISVSRLLDMVLIQVTDNGCGMSEQQQEELFKPFYTHKEKGTGLGLVLTRKMLLKMNGTIEIESRKDVGTTVNIMLPEGSGGR